MTPVTVEAKPVPLSIDLDRTALLIIDMQRDFIEVSPKINFAASTLTHRTNHTGSRDSSVQN